MTSQRPRSLLASALALSLFGALPTARAATPKAAAKDAAAKEPAAAAKEPAAGAKESAAAPADADPMAELKKAEATLRRVLAKQAPDWSPEKDVKDSEVRKLMSQLFDFEELGKRALAKHWDGLTAKQRADFLTTFRELVERSYLRQIHGRPDYDLKFLKQTRNGDEATVTAQLDTASRGKKVQVGLDYRVHWNKNRWTVFDVVTDEQSLLETYRAEFNKIINKESFDALLKRMKKKLDDKPAAAGTSAAASTPR